MATCCKELHESELSEAVVARLRALDSKDPRYVSVPDNLGGEIGALLLGSMAVFSVVLFVARIPGFYAKPWFWVALVTAPLLLAYGSKTLRRRITARLKREAVYIGDEFVFEMRPQFVRLWPLTLCTDAKATHHYRNGVYSGTRVDCVFSGGDTSDRLSFNGSLDGGRGAAITSLILQRRTLARSPTPKTALDWFEPRLGIAEGAAGPQLEHPRPPANPNR